MAQPQEVIQVFGGLVGLAASNAAFKYFEDNAGAIKNVAIEFPPENHPWPAVVDAFDCGIFNDSDNTRNWGYSKNSPEPWYSNHSTLGQ